MGSWASFEGKSPELAEAGRRLLVGEDGVAIAFLSTCDDSLSPHISPICPIFAGDHLYLSAAGRTPKVRDLRESGEFALHAFLGENDEEFQVSGGVNEIRDPSERSAVHEAIPFPSFQREDPIFRLVITRALWVNWERAGLPDMKAIRRRWSEEAGAVG